MTAAPLAAPARRADARRNREVVLRTAMRVFAEEGPEASLARIAQRAGVGAGTVYRHFPSKDVLLEAVLAEYLDALVAGAERWSARAAPGDALVGFLLDVIEKSAGRQYVCDALTGDRGWPRAVLAAAVRRFHEALERLLRDARQAGVIRADVRVDDLSALAVGGAALRAAHHDQDRGTRLVRLLLEGLRTRTVTKPDPFRDPPSPPRHETPRHCAECGAPLPARTTGRPPRYCGSTCRQRAHRRRLAG
ncbi:Transcriptional regulator, TetR family [[Actinomadura] parvosata subsp. kistnae]|uniref:TetR family transcriptional regulator n=1 Tax=[Actinomadura] parvosata subsp. kistnae TaxID=1909395 RepID=A0A1U9ZY96_9ACTN|nr:TetR/AcrR family transcriptional regulator [Nonomuraea sp. ATCC 55076]AQZ62889.1 TetR family transcriptional regulator [Nonomuraea sp. ATCC 55076]SPL95775.1 Transcriptional regulator, TetR family [Actinomadura parvosata subsp. kistnae]